MTKEQFALVAEGAGFVRSAIPYIFKHPDWGIYVYQLELKDPTMMKISWNLEYEIEHPITLQRLTHLFKAFQK